MWGDAWPTPSTASSTKFYEWLPQQPEFSVFFSSQDTVDRVKRLQKAYWAGFFSGVVDQPYVDYRNRIGEIHAQRDLPSLIYFAAVLRFQLLFLEELQTSGWQRSAAA